MPLSGDLKSQLSSTQCSGRGVAYPNRNALRTAFRAEMSVLGITIHLTGASGLRFVTAEGVGAVAPEIMSIPPDGTSGNHRGDNWYPSTGSASGFNSSPPAAPRGLPYGSPYGQSSAGAQYGGPAAGPYFHAPSNPPPSGSGGAVVKWLVIGCLGCSGIAALGFIGLLLLGLLGSASDPASSGPAKTTTVTSGPSDNGGDEASASTASPDDSTAEQEPDSTTADPASPDPAGMSSETEFATLTVTSTERTQVLRDSLFEYTTNNEYFVLHLDYTNTSSEAQSLWASDFRLVDTAGKEYSSNTDVSLAVEKPIIIDEVNPGLTLQGTIVFEVPPGTEFSELRLEESFGTSESLTIVFQ
jgi:hypothetical protein